MSRSTKSIIYFLSIVISLFCLVTINLYLHVSSLKLDYENKELVLMGTELNYPYYNDDKDIFIQSFINEIDIDVISRVDYLINKFDEYTNILFRLYDNDYIVDYGNLIFNEDNNLIEPDFLIENDALVDKMKLYSYHQGLDLTDSNISVAKKSYYFNESDLDIYLTKYDYLDSITKITLNYKELNGNITFSFKEDKTYKLMEEIEEDELVPFVPIIPPVEKENNKKKVAFTFDDGPTSYTLEIMDALDEFDAGATFFLVGYNVKRNPGILSEIHKRGYEIANHTIDHSRLTTFTCEKSRAKLQENSDLIFSIIGERPKLFRPPYGAIDDRILECIDEPVIMWSVDPRDWESRNTEEVVFHILENLKDGDVVLFHDLYPSTVDAIKILLPILYDDDFELVTVSELFESKNIPLESHNIYRRQ